MKASLIQTPCSYRASRNLPVALVRLHDKRAGQNLPAAADDRSAPRTPPGHSGTGISVRAAEAPSQMAFPRNSTVRLHFAVAVGRYSRHESQE
jgi:hypothetical protein